MGARLYLISLGIIAVLMVGFMIIGVIAAAHRDWVMMLIMALANGVLAIAFYSLVERFQR